MKVALFASAYHPHLGGVEEAVRHLALSLRDREVSSIVLTNRWPRSLPPYELYQGIPLYRLPLRVPDGSPKAHVNYYLTHRLIRRQMCRILRKEKVDLLNVHCVSANGYYALLAKRLLRLPLVVTAHGERTIDASGLYQRSTFMNDVLRQLLHEADYVTACSRHTLDDLEVWRKQSLQEKARPIYNGVDLGEFARYSAYVHPKPYILAIGRLVRQKGFDILLRAFAMAELISHDLLIAGDGPERPALEFLHQRLGLNGRVQFLGPANRPLAIALFKGCSFFTMPSRDEPQGIVLLEAMAAGKAIIASRVGGVPEVVGDGVNGVLVPPDDINALAQALRRLAADSDLRQQLANANQAMAQRFDWSSVAQCYLDVYAKITEMRAGICHTTPVA